MVVGRHAVDDFVKEVVDLSGAIPFLERTVVNVLDVMASALIMTDPVCRWISRASTLLSPRLLELRLWKQH